MLKNKKRVCFAHTPQLKVLKLVQVLKLRVTCEIVEAKTMQKLTTSN